MYDVMGDDILGDDILNGEDEEMGAPLSFMHHGGGRGGGRFPQGTRNFRGLNMAPSRPIARHNFPLGFTQLAVAASATVNVQAQPQVEFRGKRLVIPAIIGVNFVVVSITIGNRLEFVAAGAVPALTYSETAVGTGLNLHTAQVGQLIVLQVTNTDAANPHDFRATLLGDSIERGPC